MHSGGVGGGLDGSERYKERRLLDDFLFCPWMPIGPAKMKICEVLRGQTEEGSKGKVQMLMACRLSR